MSEELNQADTVQAPAEVEDQATTTTEATQATEPAKAEEKIDPMTLVPKKYRNEDGTVDMDRFVKGHLALDKFVGSKGGMPVASIEDYQYDFGEGFEVDVEASYAFKEKAKAAGFSKEQYAFAMSEFTTHLQQQAEAMAASSWTSEKIEANLKEAWGNDYDAKLKAAGMGFNTMADPDDDLTDPVWNHPSIMKMLARVGAEFGEDSVSQRKAPTARAPSVSRAQIDEIIASDKYRNGDPESHKMVGDWFSRNAK